MDSSSPSPDRKGSPPELPKNCVRTLDECQPCRLANTQSRPYGIFCGAEFRKKGYKDLFYCTREAEFRGAKGYWVCSRHRGSYITRIESSRSPSPLPSLAGSPSILKLRSEPTPLQPIGTATGIFPEEITISSMDTTPEPSPPFNSLVSSAETTPSISKKSIGPSKGERTKTELSDEEKKLRLEELTSILVQPSPRISEKSYRTHFIFHEDGKESQGWYLGELTENELTCLDHELKTYSVWMEILELGLAPSASYARPEYAERLQLVRKYRIYEAAGFDSVEVKDSKTYAYGTRWLQVVCEAERTWPFYADDQYLVPSFRRLPELDISSEEKEEAWKYSEQPLGSLLDFLCDPLDTSDDFSLGYKPLPLTTRLITNWNRSREVIPPLTGEETEFWHSLYRK